METNKYIWPRDELRSPFPFFGGKSRVAAQVWRAFGDVNLYVEPFFGSGAVLLRRPHAPHSEVINDKDGYVANFWRAVQADPDAVAYYADNPVNECDLTARHIWLTRQQELLVARLKGDHTYYDPIVAGYWVWGISQWLGGGFCSGKGPWHSVDGLFCHASQIESPGVNQILPLLDGARGVNQKVPLLNTVTGVNQQLDRQETHLEGLTLWMRQLADRLRHVRVACGDWTRVLGKAVTQDATTTGVFLDPPYLAEGRSEDLYVHDVADIAAEVAAWATLHGNLPGMRIALCGYDGNYEMPGDWRVMEWKTGGGMGRNNGRGLDNRHRERVWFSPGCLDWDNETLSLF